MKKVMFIIHFGDLKKSSGIIEKVYNQSTAMHKLGIHYKTYILYKAEQESDAKSFKHSDYIEFVPLKFFKKEKTFIKNYIIINKIFNEYKRICLMEKDKYDYVYLRMNPLYPGFIKFVQALNNKIIFEHNSIEKEEYIANKQNNKVIMSKLFDKYIRKRAKGYVCVTKEIYNYQKGLYTNQKGVVISNGINVKSFQLRTLPVYDQKNLNMIFVGNIRYWHGVDRIVKSLQNYEGDAIITFNICGLVNQDEDNLTPLINSFSKKSIKINLLGYKAKDEMNIYFNQAHLAIGCLAGYRKNMQYGSVLKNREYFARGVPIIFSEIDDDISIDDNKGLYLQVSNDDSPIKMETIIDFAKDFYKDVEKNTMRIRKFAEEQLDYSKKILKLKQLLVDIDANKDI